MEGYGKPVVLLMDDDEDHREVVTSVLMREGYAVFLAQTAAQALEHLASINCPVFVLINIPPGGELWGHEVLRRLEGEALPRVYLYALMSNPTTQARLAAMSEGAHRALSNLFIGVDSDFTLAALRADYKALVRDAIETVRGGA